jgi:hypothetical protein
MRMGNGQERRKVALKCTHSAFGKTNLYSIYSQAPSSSRYYESNNFINLVWIMNSKGEVILQKRAPQKESYPNMWDISSAGSFTNNTKLLGHISAGDEPLDSGCETIPTDL